MFSKSAHLYDAIYTSFKNYEMEAERVHAIIQEHVPGASTLLDVACGTGLHLEHLSSHYEAEGVDLDPQMLDIARQRLPGVPLTVGGMAEFDLQRSFDAVTCLFSSIGYLLSAEMLNKGITNMTRHLRPGGVLIVEPWITPDQWLPKHPEAVFVDHPSLKIARMGRMRRRGEHSLLTFHYLVGTKDGVNYFTELHESRLHSHSEYLACLASAGLSPEFDPEGLMGRG
ncbi:MAG TPA: class I SAM-dependent methyltransferase, partial [Actinomycetota bacterium]|nr:class I SAM-dependent methyltransferase [Actinomycetota bacterium]